MVKTTELRELLGCRHEWLLVRERGSTFPLQSDEIEITDDGERASFGFLDDKGFHVWHLNGFAAGDGEVTIDVAGAFAKKRETMRLVPRASASALAAEVERARLEKANELAGLIANTHPGIKVGRVRLNADNGRLAQINFDRADWAPTAAIADVTGGLTVEAIFTAAMVWLEKLGLRKKRAVGHIWLICENRQAKNAQKLHALLSPGWQDKITIVEVLRKHDSPLLAQLPKRKLGDLWRQGAAKLFIPGRPQPGPAAQRIIDLSPSKVDVIYSRQGETLRFLGLPFARVRTLMGKEKVWVGVGRDVSILTEENAGRLTELIELLEDHRAFDGKNKRHRFYRAAPEAWLESVLRRNIRLLDANLILSPIYNQFRSSNDKIDLLALRRDGRLVIIELKTQPDREGVFQAVDYWRKIELQRRRGILAAADLFDGREIIDKPALIYLVAPAWSFHRDFEFFARAVSPEIELWRFELHQKWRHLLKVLQRRNVNEKS